jgi:hypothetical protein
MELVKRNTDSVAQRGTSMTQCEHNQRIDQTVFLGLEKDSLKLRLYMPVDKPRSLSLP